VSAAELSQCCYNIGSGTVACIMNRYKKLLDFLKKLTTMPPKKVEETFYPPENLRQIVKELSAFFRYTKR